MFNNDLFSDVKFVVPIKAVGESESKQVIPAHKFLLSISSPVFEAMFYGELAETTDSIELPDCEYESLLELFRYMYSDEVNLSGSNVVGVLYLAKKYMVPSLADKCAEYLHDDLDPSNVFSILSCAQKYELKNLLKRCWKVIDQRTEEAVKSDGFGTIERSLLEAVVVRDALTIEEIELFKAVDLWATKECERQGLTEDSSVKRRVLGDQIVKGIRFPTMELEDFASVVLDSDILTKEEIVSIVKCLGSVPKSSVGFLETKRSGMSVDIHVRCCRFGSVNASNSWKYRGSRDAIKFSADKDIVLQGLRLFGSENNTYSVELKITDAMTGVVLVSKTGQFSSGLLECKTCNYDGFELLFDSKVSLKKTITYEIIAKISGSPSPRGVECLTSVQCSGVTFTFTKSEHSSNGTGPNHGQFSELLFYLK